MVCGLDHSGSQPFDYTLSVGNAVCVKFKSR